jgi:hypothetical protein
MIAVDTIFKEPLLEFGSGGTSFDIRHGVANFGPVEHGTIKAKTHIRMGLVGGSKSIGDFVDWMNACAEGLKGVDDQNPHFSPDFPGLGASVGFRCQFVTDQLWTDEIADSEMKSIASKPGAIIALSEFFFKRIKAMYELSTQPDVVVCLPSEFVRKKVKPKHGEDRADDEVDFDGEPDAPDFHDYLKALCVQQRIAFQLVWPRTYSNNAKGVQDLPTRCWNLFGAIFYKAGGIPWKLHKPPGTLNTCYIGISFARRPDNAIMHSSLTQVFNDRGEGTILRGGQASRSNDDWEYHLSGSSANTLVTEAIKNYANANGQRIPDRVVIHKSSGFDSHEYTGFEEAVTAAGVRFCDFLALTRSDLRLFRVGSYPPLRGTHVILDETASILYTRGSVVFYRKYPGPYVPRCLHIRYFKSDRSQRELAAEILALTKLNWNKTQFDSFWPITLSGSRQIGTIYNWCPDPPSDALSYSLFM